MNRLFIFGAGFSHHLSGGNFPLTASLGRAFKNEHPWVMKYLPDDNTDNINLEHILTKLDLDVEYKKSGVERKGNLKNRKEIIDYIKTQLSLDKVKADQMIIGQTLCSKLFKDGDSIVSFNYDILLEHILWRLKYWSPNGGYGDFPCLNDPSKYGSTMDKNPKNIVVLKPHGSLNFLEFKTDSGIYLLPRITDDFFPKIHADWYSESYKRLQSLPILLPSFVKIFGENRTFIYIWHDAIKRVKEADTIIIIGYSLPRSDTMTRFLLSFICKDEFKARGINRLKIGILNKGDDSDYVARQLFEVARVGREDIDFLILHDVNNQDYERISQWAKEELNS